MRTLIAIAVAILLGWAAGWHVNGMRWQSKYDKRETQYQKEQVDKLNDEIEKSETLRKENLKLKNSLTVIEGERNVALENNRKANADLADCLRTGKCGVRVAATCPGAGGVSNAGMPTGSGAVSANDDAGARLTPAAESAFLALREGIGRVQEKLRWCQQDRAEIDAQFDK